MHVFGSPAIVQFVFIVGPFGRTVSRTVSLFAIVLEYNI